MAKTPTKAKGPTKAKSPARKAPGPASYEAMRQTIKDLRRDNALLKQTLAKIKTAAKGPVQSRAGNMRK